MRLSNETKKYVLVKRQSYRLNFVRKITLLGLILKQCVESIYTITMH
jgi:hypothetical protein